MEANKIKGEAKSIHLDNSVELTYCERGQENKEILLTGAFYFHTLLPVIEKLAERYHVYGIVMRFDGPTDELNKDGTTNWTRQWGKDVYDFSRKMDISKFHYVGKCHGTVPGWYMVKEHPEVMDTFASFFLTPHVCEQNSANWYKLLSGNNTTEMMRVAMRKPEGLKAKMDEMESIGSNASGPIIALYGASPEKIWPDRESCAKALKTMMIPVEYLFGTQDPLFEDYYDSNMYAIKNTKGARTVILQGECHLMELDCPDRIASEIFNFIDESRKSYS